MEDNATNRQQVMPSDRLIELVVLATAGSGAAIADVDAALCGDGLRLDPEDVQSLRIHLETQGLLHQVGDDLTYLITPAGQRTILALTGELLAEIRLSDTRAAKLSAEHSLIEHLRTDFLSTMSHELRTPLTLIRTSIGLLLDTEPDEEMRQRLLRNVKQSSDRMHALVNDLLDLARLRGNRLELRIRRLDTGDLIEAVVSMMRLLFDQKSQKLEASVPSPAPIVTGDFRRLERVLVNLLSNATKFSPEGARISITVVEEIATVKISVHDSGPGISPEAFPRLFEQFYTSRTSSSSQQIGAGLGLPIAKGIVEAHGGTMSVESTPDHGSTFSFTLPSVPIREEHDETASGR
jgi:signal transduction histidine kinase